MGVKWAKSNSSIMKYINIVLETPSLEELHLEEEWIESSGNILPEGLT